MELKGAKRAPNWFGQLYKLQSRIKNIDARYLEPHSIRPVANLLAKLVSELHGRLLEANKDYLARELLEEIGNLIQKKGEQRG